MFGVSDGWEETTGRRYGSEVERGEEAADENLSQKNTKHQDTVLVVAVWPIHFIWK